MAQFPAARIPPHSEEAEGGILGIVLFDGKLLRKALKRGLQPSSFYKPANIIIFESAIRLLNNGSVIDQITIVNDLKDRKKLETIGGVQYLTSMMDSVVKAHYDYYLTIVLEKADKRNLAIIADEAKAAAFEPDSQAMEVMSKFKYSLHKLSSKTQEKETVSEIVGRLAGSFRRAGKEGYAGIRSRWNAIRHKIVGYKPKKITIIAGRPGQGKTTLALNEVLDKALQGIAGLIISIEMTKEEIIAKLISDLMGINIETLEAGNADPKDIYRFEEGGRIIESLPIYIEDGNANIVEIASMVREYREDRGVEICVVDYMQIISPTPGKKYANRNAELSDVSNEFLHLGNDTGVHFFLISQLSRAANFGTKNNKPAEPELHHLRDCGSLEQDAYIVMFVYEDPSYEEEDFVDNTPMIIKIAKQRGGKRSKVNMIFNKTNSRFIGPDHMLLDAMSAAADLKKAKHEAERERQEAMAKNQCPF